MLWNIQKKRLISEAVPELKDQRDWQKRRTKNGNPKTAVLLVVTVIDIVC